MKRSWYREFGRRKTDSNNIYQRWPALTNLFSTVTIAVDEHRITGDHNNCLTKFQDDVASIIRPYYQDQRPVVVRGAVKDAPATRLWTTWEYWQQIVAKDEVMVTVEMGGSYGSEQSERAEIPFLDYLQYLKMFEERHGRSGVVSVQHKSFSSRDQSTVSSCSIPSNELVYMAQNDLPHHLYKDIFIPDFCQNNSGGVEGSDSTCSLGFGRLYSVMLWLGPRGSVSPLHFDPLDNCLMQHLGRKRVLLYDPKTTSQRWHYAGHCGQQINTSPINPELLDCNDSDFNDDDLYLQNLQTNYPLFLGESPPRMECYLNPGDLLFIPAKWWHHVRSIDTTASVNVWWR
jgi:[protein]-arginine 3-hydroxylase / protease